MRNWYSMQALAAPNAAEISIYDEIGMWGVTAKQFISDLKALGDVKDITVSINSPGGSVFDGLTIYNALRASGANVTVKVMGIAASIASIIAMAGKKIVMPENSFMMIHNPLNGIYGNADDMREMADILDKVGSSLVATYVARTGKSEEEVKALMDAETYMTAAEAKELGFADEVIPAVEAKAAFEVDRLPEHIQAALRMKVEIKLEEGEVLTPEEPETQEAEPAQQAVEPVADSPLVETIRAAAKTAGFEAYAPVWALDDQIQNADDIKARVSHAKEVLAFCDIAGVKARAEEFITNHTPIADVRAALRAERVAKSDLHNVDTATKTPVQPKALKTPAQVYAERAQRLAKAS